MRTHPARAAATLGLLTFLYLLLAPAVAGAALSGDCPIDQNWAKIQGITYTAANDSIDNPVLLPAGETLEIEYLGTTSVPITDHNGQVAINLGPGNVFVEPWSNPNKPNPTLSKGGFYMLEVPNIVGVYEVTGFHMGTGGSCDGDAVIKIVGKSPLTTPVGAGAAGGTLLAGIGVGVAAVTKKGVA